jgi:hypothetical protein
MRRASSEASITAPWEVGSDGYPRSASVTSMCSGRATARVDVFGGASGPYLCAASRHPPVLHWDGEQSRDFNCIDYVRMPTCRCRRRLNTGHFSPNETCTLFRSEAQVPGRCSGRSGDPRRKRCSECTTWAEVHRLDREGFPTCSISVGTATRAGSRSEGASCQGAPRPSLRLAPSSARATCPERSPKLTGGTRVGGSRSARKLIARRSVSLPRSRTRRPTRRCSRSSAR